MSRKLYCIKETYYFSFIMLRNVTIFYNNKCIFILSLLFQSILNLYVSKLEYAETQYQRSVDATKCQLQLFDGNHIRMKITLKGILHGKCKTEKNAYFLGQLMGSQFTTNVLSNWTENCSDYEPLLEKQIMLCAIPPLLFILLLTRMKLLLPYLYL